MQRRVFLTALLGAGAAPWAARAQGGDAPVSHAPVSAAPPPAAPATRVMALEPIVPANALERAFVDAAANEALRPAFRRALLESDVIVAVTGTGDNVRPRLVPLNGGVRAAAIFTSPTRLDEGLGRNQAALTMSGRRALTRLRHQHVVINYGLAPMLTLDPQDVQHFLAISTEPSQ
ncbi:MAG TPA: SseB family protein [Caulobacterales bacterium]|nr:SseB family protein [Caulobacterales bacterium]